MPPKRGFSYKDFTNKSNKNDKQIISIEISAETLVSRLQPLKIEDWAAEIRTKMELKQRRRELLANYVPLYDGEQNLLFTSYEIDKLANDEKIDKLEDALDIQKLEINKISQKSAKRRKVIDFDEINEEGNVEDQIKLEIDMKSESENESSDEESENEVSVDMSYDENDSESDNSE